MNLLLSVSLKWKGVYIHRHKKGLRISLGFLSIDRLDNGSAQSILTVLALGYVEIAKIVAADSRLLDLDNEALMEVILAITEVRISKLEERSSYANYSHN